MGIERSKDYYRTVNGQRILVHGHNYEKAQEEQHAEEPSKEAYDSEFDSLFKTRRDEEPATSEPSQEDVGSEFDNLFGGDAEPAPEVKPQMPSPYEMGKAAFHAGKGSAPALNQEFQDAYLAKGAKVGSPESKAYTEAIKAYSKGWMEANLAAPVPGVTDSPEGKGEKSEEPEGKPVVFSDLKPGHVIKGKTAGKTCMVVGKQGELLLFQTPKGNLFQTSKVNVEENYELVSDDPSAYTFAEGEDGPTVGQTKTISGTTYFFNRNHRWEKQGEEPKAEQEQAPAPESPAPETSPISGKITGLNPGGNHGDNSTFTTPKGVQLIRSKQGNGAYLYINKHYSTGEESGTILPKKLKDAILAIPGASLNAPHMKKKTAWMEVPFEQAEAMEKVLASHEDGSLLAGQTAKKPKAPKTESVAYESGSHVPFKDLKVGMKFDAPGSNYEYEVIKKNPQSVQIKVAHKSNGGSYETKITAKHWASGYEGMCPLKGENGEGQAEHHVGETKVENGKTYVLNENHKWELAPGQEPEAKPKKKAAAKVDDAFPFKQVGPQGGAQPGGVFEDEFGQKWYIKFPPSEDVCKNEVLALKLYESILGKSSVPSVKMVHAKGIPGIASDGKMGIASKWMDGLKEDPSALASGKVANVYEGFALDAWLGNRDVVGGNQSQYKNMVVGPDNKAVRVDAGGALLYTGLGHAKNDFGADVTEVEKLLNPSVNHETARIYKGITKDQITQSVAKVLEVPDEFVKAMVDKFGPGDEAAKAALVDKLIARKNNLAKKFPEADLVAHPPAPDKRHLQVDPSKLPGMLDYFKMGAQGPTGTWVSASEAINKYNNQAAQDLYDLALKGDYVALKEYKAPDINKSTGEIVGYVPVSEHKSSKYLVPFYNSIMEHLQVLAYPALASGKQWVVPGDFSDIQALSDAHPGHEFGITVEDVPANKRLGYFISLGQVSDPHRFVPAKLHNVTGEQKSKVMDSYHKLTPKVKSYLGNVQGGPSGNIGGKKHTITDHNKQVTKEAYEGAVEFEGGTVIRRWMGMPPAMIQQIMDSEPGLVFQNQRSTCCGMRADWENQTGKSYALNYGEGTPVYLEIINADGAKVLPTAGSGAFASESEVTSLPGQRYMLLEKGGKSKLGDPKFVLLALPPDPTYVHALDPKKAA